jgi:nucleotide-binding universal stress UspA family protein
MLPIKTILHPTDFSPQAEYAYQLARSLARDYGARLLLQHVEEISPAVYGEFGALGVNPDDVHETLKEKLHRLEPPDVDDVRTFLVRGDPASEIVALASNYPCDVIVMGTHGRKGLARLLMGSVAEDVVRKAPCPVVTVKSPLAQASAGMKAEEQSAPVI